MNYVVDVDPLRISIGWVELKERKALVGDGDVTAVKGSHSQLIHNLQNNGKTLRNCCCCRCDIRRQEAELPETEIA